MYKERDLFKNRIIGFFNEIVVFKLYILDKYIFVDFVYFKRDYNLLKEEYEKFFKRRSLKIKVLLIFKVIDIILVIRVLSGGIVRSIVVVVVGRVGSFS